MKIQWPFINCQKDPLVNTLVRYICYGVNLNYIIAIASGQIFKNDLVLSINGQSVQDKTHNEVVSYHI